MLVKAVTTAVWERSLAIKSAAAKFALVHKWRVAGHLHHSAQHRWKHWSFGAALMRRICERPQPKSLDSSERDHTKTPAIS